MQEIACSNFEKQKDDIYNVDKAMVYLERMSKHLQLDSFLHLKSDVLTIL